MKIRAFIVAAALGLLPGIALADTKTYFGSPFDIDNGNSSRGSSDTITVADPGTLTGVSISITLNHTFVGELTATLQRRPGVNNAGLKQVNLFRIVGYLDSQGYGAGADLAGTYTFNDAATADFAQAANANSDADQILPPGAYRASTYVFTDDILTTNPFTSLDNTFSGLDRSGNWTLKIDDYLFDLEKGGVTAWSLSLTTNSPAPVPEPSTAALAGVGMLVLLMVRRRKASASAAN